MRAIACASASSSAAMSWSITSHPPKRKTPAGSSLGRGRNSSVSISIVLRVAPRRQSEVAAQLLQSGNEVNKFLLGDRLAVHRDAVDRLQRPHAPALQRLESAGLAR